MPLITDLLLGGPYWLTLAVHRQREVCRLHAVPRFTTDGIMSGGMARKTPVAVAIRLEKVSFVFSIRTDGLFM